MTEVKTIGTRGQLYLGREFAGRNVVVDQPELGVWIIRTATVIPDSELWLHQPAERQRLEDAMVWAAGHSAQVSSPADLADLRTHEP